MVERERTLARRRLDEELGPYRKAGQRKNPTNGLLRAVRKALGIPMGEIAGKLGVNESAVFRFEVIERKGKIKMSSMDRVAEAMGCKLVYGIVPKGGKTLNWLAEKRLWESILCEEQGTGNREQGTGNREQGTGIRDQGSGVRE